MPRLLAVALSCCLAGTPSSALAQCKDSLPAVVPEKPQVAPRVLPELADWTPRPARGKAEWWEKATDKDWVDPRFRSMDTGPFLNATIDYPLGIGRVRNYKATAVKLRTGGAVFDRTTLRLAALWTGRFLQHSDSRFGLLNTPTPAGEIGLATAASAGWANANGNLSDGNSSFRRPLPAEWGKYRGLYLHGDRVVFRYTVHNTDVLESVTVDEGFTDTLNIGPCPARLERVLRSLASGSTVTYSEPLTALIVEGPNRELISLTGDTNGVEWRVKSGSLSLVIPPSSATRKLAVHFAKGESARTPGTPPEDLTTYTRPGPSRWGKPLITRLERGADSGPFAIDTLTIPYENPFNALFFCTGVDFLPDGRIAVSTCHGDVWLVKVNDDAGNVEWQRYATGLYQPLGLKVVEGKVVVLERGQLTRLHDLNEDGEADFYENLCNQWDTGDGQHSFDTCLESDPEGNFYFFKTGDTELPTGGCLMRVAPDGSKAEVFATGFRHPIGLGASPTGVITGADQEGNWMPATRIDEYKRGGFYGDLRASHRVPRPNSYDGPLCWVPREVDNSAGGQVWVPSDTFGPLAGLPLHLSYGRCKAFVLLRQECGDVNQGGVADLGLQFLSGACRARFHPVDGHMYVVGLNGWQTAAKADGSLQRVRYTGKPIDVPVRLAVVRDGVTLTFSRPLDDSAAGDPTRYRAAWWNYRWSGEYGSARYKVSAPDEEGQDDVPIIRTHVSEDGKTVRLMVKGGTRPVMQMQVAYNLAAIDGKPVVGSVFLTVHKTGEE